MKSFLAVLIGAIVLAATAGQAQGAGPDSARIAALERQVAALTHALAAAPQTAAQTPADRKVAALQRQTTALAKRVKTLETKVTQLQGIAGIGLVIATCSAAMTADALTGTWNVIDQIATTAQAKTYFGQQAVVNDYQSCSSLQLTRQQTVPPSVAPFSALTALLGGRTP